MGFVSYCEDHSQEEKEQKHCAQKKEPMLVRQYKEAKVSGSFTKAGIHPSHPVVGPAAWAGVHIENTCARRKLSDHRVRVTA